MITIFIGSSAAARPQARAIIRAFTRPGLKFLPWWSAFTAGRNKRHAVPNLNVLFELGYFYGHFGEQKVAMVKYGEFYLPRADSSAGWPR